MHYYHIQLPILTANFDISGSFLEAKQNKTWVWQHTLTHRHTKTLTQDKERGANQFHCISLLFGEGCSSSRKVEKAVEAKLPELCVWWRLLYKLLRSTYWRTPQCDLVHETTKEDPHLWPQQDASENSVAQMMWERGNMLLIRCVRLFSDCTTFH